MREKSGFGESLASTPTLRRDLQKKKHEYRAR